MKENKELVEAIKKEVYKSESTIKDLLIKFININSVNPRQGGPGEKEVADFLYRFMIENCFDQVEVINAIDEEFGDRPNIIGTIKGEDPSKRIWIIAHMDKVPEGNRDLWSIDPFKGVEKEGKIFGRGAEDNGQAVVSSIFTGITLKKLNLKPIYDLKILLVSDEETGSKYGIEYLRDKGLFHKNDLIIVPDAGVPDGSFIEIAEKSILWIKIIVNGKQVHASVPDQGINATRLGMKFALELDSYLHEKYSLENSIFVPPVSTFEPTKKEKNVDNVNTIPGTDIQYFDCRILPEYNLEKIKEDIKLKVEQFSNEYEVEVIVEFPQEAQAPQPTPVDSEVVKKLKIAIKDTRGIEPKVGGIGGGTCAAILRRKGYKAVVWETIDETAHQPDEYCRVENLLNDIIVFTYFSLIR